MVYNDLMIRYNSGVLLQHKPVTTGDCTVYQHLGVSTPYSDLGSDFSSFLLYGF